MKLTCPHCHAGLDRTTSPYGKYAPAHGDFNICAKCRKASKFNFEGGAVLVKLDEHELAILRAEFPEYVEPTEDFLWEKIKGKR